MWVDCMSLKDRFSDAMRSGPSCMQWFSNKIKCSSKPTSCEVSLILDHPQLALRPIAAVTSGDAFTELSSVVCCKTFLDGCLCSCLCVASHLAAISSILLFLTMVSSTSSNLLCAWSTTFLLYPRYAPPIPAIPKEAQPSKKVLGLFICSSTALSRYIPCKSFNGSSINEGCCVRKTLCCPGSLVVVIPTIKTPAK